MFFHVVVMLLSVFVAAVAQVLLKKSAGIEYSSKIREYLNFYVIGGYGIMVFSSLLSVYAYQKVPLSLGTVLQTTSYIYITFFGVVLFKEKLSLSKIGALVLIISGVLFFLL